MEKAWQKCSPIRNRLRVRLSLRLAPLLAAALEISAARADASRERSQLQDPTTAGAWIWTRPDARLLEEARVAQPGLRAAVHVATIERLADGSHVSRRALSPDVVRGPSHEVAVVVRFADSLHADWTPGSEIHVAQAVAPLLSRILEEVDATGVRADEIQLDYDAPVRALASWARVVGALAAGPLRNRDVWITSIPAHVEIPDYGSMFAPTGAGHILQIFDTGLACTTENASALASRLAAAGLRFRIGVAGFERTARPGAHECWRMQAASWRALPGYAGVWVFPAERDIRLSLAPFEAP
jgi:hypothetical protein